MEDFVDKIMVIGNQRLDDQGLQVVFHNEAGGPASGDDGIFGKLTAQFPGCVIEIAVVEEKPFPVMEKLKDEDTR